MENRRKFSQSVLAVSLVTALLLMVPFVAMQFTDEVVWGIGDFIIMGVLLFSAGLSYITIIRLAPNFIYRIAIGLALGTALIMIWANLAVGLIGSGPNLGNLMYIVVLAVAIIGTILSRLSPGGMERAMYSTAFSLILVAAIGLIASVDESPGSSVNEVVGVNGFLALLFVISGALFRYSAHEQSPGKSKG